MKIKKQTEEFRQVIEDQEKLIELNLEMTSKDMGGSLPVSFDELVPFFSSLLSSREHAADKPTYRIEAVNEEIERLRTQIKDQRNQLEADRKEFIKAAIDLGRERAELSVSLHCHTK